MDKIGIFGQAGLVLLILIDVGIRHVFLGLSVVGFSVLLRLFGAILAGLCFSLAPCFGLCFGFSFGLCHALVALSSAVWPWLFLLLSAPSLSLSLSLSLLFK